MGLRSRNYVQIGINGYSFIHNLKKDACYCNSELFEYLNTVNDNKSNDKNMS